MKTVMWILAGVGALLLLGGVVLPIVSWLLGALVWVVAGALVIGGGLWLAQRHQAGRVERSHDPQQLS